MDTDLKPLSMIYNEKSGFHANHKDEVYEKLMTIWTTHGFEIQVFELNQKVDFDEMMKSVLSRHQQADLRGVVVAAGGDGKTVPDFFQGWSQKHCRIQCKNSQRQGRKGKGSASGCRDDRRGESRLVISASSTR